MRYELRDYQRDAALEILKRLRQSRRDFEEGERSSFALSAITGSGKTVIATTVIEACSSGRPTSTPTPTRGSPSCGSPTIRPSTARRAGGCSTHPSY